MGVLLGVILGYLFLMTLQDYDTKLLIKKRGYWYYQRRVPKKFAHVDPRRYVKKALRTKAVDEAIAKRDALIKADNEYWTALSLEAAQLGDVSETRFAVEQHRYNAAKARALSFGITYSPVSDLAAHQTSAQIYERVAILMKQSPPNALPKQEDVDALLGGVTKPNLGRVKISKAFKLYLDKISYDDQHNKDADQLYNWKKTKTTSIDYFIQQMGDLNMDDITREIALRYEDWWRDKLKADINGKRAVKPNTANRHIGNMRGLYSAYFKYIGDEDRRNPFRNMRFKGVSKSTVATFENEWVRERILVPGLFDRLNIELRSMIFVLIETGARMSEVCNLMPEDIHLDEEVPYISIRPRETRELKTVDSERDLPLVGVALEAMKLTPRGYDKYRGKGTLVSANLMKAFRTRELLPTKDHVIYSFRHAFEKRMQEADIDYGLRCTLMGHKNTRPAYGDGGSLAYRRDELLKIVHPFSDRIFS